ncbi:MAG: RagB/SusD family nutrient uptake outer membrane protein [Bacteroidota bacterium]|nr:RagB/SusD family nutrient uptake outer membrane protein [Bacteroidota bacterium]
MLFILITIISGCEDFLESNPQGIPTQESFPTTEDDALLATNAVYSTLRSWSYHSGGYPILDIMSDDAHKGSNPDDQRAILGPYDTFTFTTTQDPLDNWWNTLYEGIKRANVVIEYVQSISMNENLRTRSLGEARFLRALYYFDLVRAWGGVPIVETTTPPLTLARSSEAEVYILIVNDLLISIENLREKSELPAADLGRATKGAARALLAKVYLFRGDFANAEIYALEVINSQQYDLEPNFEHANSIEGENGVESVFEIGALQVEGDPGNQYANTQGVRGSPNKGWGFNRPSISLRGAFEAGDPRQQLTIIELGDVIDDILILGDGTTPDEYNNGYTTEIESYNRKVWVPGSNTISNWGHNRRLIRYADVLLMAAEALNENDKPELALQYLNQVRQRARGDNPGILPDITETNKDVLKEIILNERRVELALEGHRFWDLVRTGKAPEVLGPIGFVTGRHELLPIPQNQIDLSQGTLTQNNY